MTDLVQIAIRYFEGANRAAGTRTEGTLDRRLGLLIERMTDDEFTEYARHTQHTT